MRLFPVTAVCAVTAVFALSACSPAPAPRKSVPADETKQAWYAQTISQLTSINAHAEALWKSGKPDGASSLIQQGEPLVSRLLSVSSPTLAATEAAADLDSLYGRMLLANRHYGWARLLFQKNESRWRHWKPQTPETLRRLKEAAASIAECDRQMGV